MRAELGLLAGLALAATACSSAIGPSAPTTADAVTATTVPTTLLATTTSASTTTTTAALPRPWGAPQPPPETPPAAALLDGFAGVGTVVVAAGGADLTPHPGEAPFVRARQGVPLGATSWDGEWIEVITTCDEAAWVHRSEVLAVPPAAELEVGEGFDFADAVIVVDPGHGGPHNIGAVGPEFGTLEKDNNVLIARRLRHLLETPHVVDWDSGRILIGDRIPPASRVIVTRVGLDADYEAGLPYRAAIANTANAHALVSIHNNAGQEVALDHPGSDVYYQSQTELMQASRRLATILAEEFQRGFSAFAADWVGDARVGAKSRTSMITPGEQLYGILRRTEVPAVIAEGAYLASGSEEALLRTPPFQQAYADAVYRALVRFLTTDDSGDAPSWDPEMYRGTRPSGDARAGCQVPAQDG